MTDPRDTADYLEALAASIRGLGDRVRLLERSSLEEILDASRQRLGGDLGYDRLRVGADTLAATLGNVRPFFGQTNVLEDPSFENFQDISTTTTENTYGIWRAKYVLDSGSAPGITQFAYAFGRQSDYNPFNSDVIALFVNSLGFGASTTTHYLYPNDGFVTDANLWSLPYLVASCRVGDFGNLTTTLTSITSITVTLQIINASDTVVAESPALDYKAMVGRRPEVQQLVAAMSAATGTYRWRLKAVIVASANFGPVRIQIGEPMLHFAYSPDPAPFSPQIARHYPIFVGNAAVASASPGPLATTSYAGQTGALYSIRADGRHAWADGIGGSVDAVLERSPNGGLRVGDSVSGGVIDQYDGANNFNAFTPTVSNHGGATFTTRAGWWQRIGKMVYVAIEVAVNGAGSGTSTVTISLPFSPDTTIRQMLPGTRVGSAPFGPIGCLLDSSQISQIRQNDATIVDGASLTSSGALLIEGWYRSA